ncbi:MAG: hypothetical protein LOY01_11050 [Brachybacterium paraconglomeratum]|nr:hypothetical protein [Brachybacterium paraconglomeratum]
MTTATAPAGRRRRRSRPDVVARRTGYAVAAAFQVAMLWSVNVWPGWEAVPFLTGETTQVLGIVNASLLVALVLDVLLLAADPPQLKALSDLVTTAVGLAALIALWRVFPFAFADGGFDWALLVRWVLGVGIAGSAVGILVALVDLVRGSDSRS